MFERFTGRGALERRLTRATARLRALREELAVVDEQLRHLAEEADDLGVRALVSDDPATAPEARRAGEHHGALARHRAHVVAQIAGLERTQDALLDRWSSA